MSMDETRTLPEPQRDDGKPVFQYGELTIGVMSEQAFALDDFATRAGGKPLPLPVAVEAEEIVAASSDPLLRIEEKLNIALAAISALQRRVDSIDETLARLISR